VCIIAKLKFAAITHAFNLASGCVYSFWRVRLHITSHTHASHTHECAHQCIDLRPLSYSYNGNGTRLVILGIHFTMEVRVPTTWFCSGLSIELYSQRLLYSKHTIKISLCRQEMLSITDVYSVKGVQQRYSTSVRNYTGIFHVFSGFKIVDILLSRSF